MSGAGLISWAGWQPWSPWDFSQSQVSLDLGQLHDTPWESMITFNLYVYINNKND